MEAGPILPPDVTASVSARTPTLPHRSRTPHAASEAAVASPTAPSALNRVLLHLRAALPSWVAARAVVALTFLTAHALVESGVLSSGVAVHHLHQGLLGWDAERYTDIAERGYAALPLVELRFFPLVPMIARGLGAIFGNAGLALVLVANVAALGFGALVHALCLHERGDERLARRATWFVAFTPAAFVLVWGYSEAVWGCLAVGAMLALRRKRWWAAAALGLLGGLSRPVGALLVLPALVEAVRGLPAAKRNELAARLAAVAAPLAGTGAYLAWVGVNFGDPLLPFRIQQHPKFRGDLADPISSLAGIVATAFRDGPGAGSARLVWVVLLVGLAVGTCRSWPASYGLLAAAALLVALSTDRLGSFERYGFAAFPLVLHLAAVARAETARRVVTAAGGGAMAVYGTLALLGRYVP